MILLNRKVRRRRGTAAVEFGFLLPFILILLLGLWEVGRLIEVNQLLYNAAREGCRQASTGLINNNAVQQVVINYLKNAGLPTQNVSVTVQDLTNPGTDVSNATWMDQLQVIVTIPCDDVTWSSIDLTTNSTSKLTVQAIWNSMKDQTYPTTINPPPGS
ncbi:MAG TPA: TadE/TadG family type IV pilus assembly protein [Gemmataceae bacterium]|nr:TadE/TadG family type IV pilus assembly protein [Gemmataceae bacterium]